jgi:peptidoglycan hydrolase-like protein with peptidoglycan-binding domain
MLQSRRLGRDEQLQKASNNAPPLRRGATGSGVATLQDILVDLGFPLPISFRKKNAADGIFGPETEDAAIKFQKRYGLVPDGCAGRLTLAMLDQLIGKYPALETPCPYIDAAICAYDSCAPLYKKHTAMW